MLGMSLVLGFATALILIRPTLPPSPRFWQLGLLAVAVQVPVYLWGWNTALLRLGYALLIVVAFANRQAPGGRLICLGLLLNALPILIYGRMPIAPDMLAWGNQTASIGSGLAWSKDIVQKPTPLLLLGDVLPISVPGYKAAWSIGDVLLVLGVLHYCAGSPHRSIRHRTGAA